MPIENKKFRKTERLCSQKIIGALFESGTVLKRFPFKVIYERSEYSQSPVKVLISVPKKMHRRAVRRNFIRRKIREAYRLKKQSLYKSVDGAYTLNIILIYIASNIFSYAEIEKKIEQILTELGENITQGSNYDTDTVN